MGQKEDEKGMRKRILVRIVVAVMILGLALGGVSQALAQPSPGQQPERYIVVTSSHAVNQAVEKAALENGGITLREFTTFSGMVVLISRRALERIERIHGVLRVYADPIVTTLGPPPWAGGKKESKAEVLPWGVDRIDAELVWDANSDLTLDSGAITGLGVKLGIVDTGIDKDHPDLQANIKGGRNFVAKGGPPWNPKIDPEAWDDDNGHGSHVAGIAAAVENEEGVIGVAPQAYLYAVKVLDRTGSGYLSDVIAGIEWCIDPNGDGDTSDRMDVINLSLGTTTDYPELHDAIIAADNAGIVVVAAAGNESGGEVIYPAKYAEAIAVSATDATDTIASFSSTGTEVELAAPGVDVYSTYKDGEYETLSGTSMAAPHVAGTAALVIATGIADANGDGVVTNTEVRQHLQNTADDLGTTGKDDLYGHGLVDAEEAATGVETG
jgi:subtilisin family serine protease